ncbi:single-stranded DNA-binding protein [candidate division WWE3 bacterium]|uniref:Single-stranded DNA-binding protein n=1 Tax=candidate division WWE3 bacterium TaxID=2053526 RepID=A0A7X9E7G1_UNCKA|nr:single-stranded DNA-binding protein [candidate division WWE3 bacterium]
MASRNLNKVMLIGNLTKDPEVRYTPQGNAVASFVIATNREWVTQGEKKQSVDFHNVVAWNKLAEICGQLLKKGTKVFVEGRLQTRDWVGEDGKKRYKTEIIIDDMIILTPKKAGEESSVDEDLIDVEAPEAEEVGPEEEVNLDDLGDLDLGGLDSEEEEKEKKEK